MMGNAAENEKSKFKATYYNIVAVVVMAAGVLWPLLMVYGHIPEFVPAPGLVKWFLTLLPPVVAFFVAKQLRESAIKVLDEIED
jgi:hypothetical protein